jgi:hypothetical protein
MLLLYYPVLSVENNVGLALEGRALVAALRAEIESAFREEVLQWLVIRQERRAKVPAEAIEYENGVEFGEGLAKYMNTGCSNRSKVTRPVRRCGGFRDSMDLMI